MSDHPTSTEIAEQGAAEVAESAQANPSAAQIIADVMRSVGGVAKRDRNTQQKFDFRGIDAIVNAVGPAMRHLGYPAPSPRLVSVEHSDGGLTQNGAQKRITDVVVDYVWHSLDGSEPIITRVPGEAIDSSDKSTAKAMAVAWRTMLIQVLALPTDEPDPDTYYEERSGQGGIRMADPTPAQLEANAEQKRVAEALLLRASEAQNDAELGEVWREAKAAGAPVDFLDRISAYATGDGSKS